MEEKTSADVLDIYAAFDAKLAIANEVLKSANIKVHIYRRGNFLWLKATLPPKPHIDKEKSYQQSISLGFKAHDAGLESAKRKAKELGVQLDSGKFNWANWIDVKESVELVELKPTKNVEDWVAEYEEEYWSKNRATPNRLENWKKDHGLVFRNLPQGEPLTTETLIRVIKQTDPDSRTRKRYVDYCHSLAKFAGLEEADKIKGLRGSYSAKSVDPRSLPSDKEIADWRKKITNPQWRFVYGALVVWGLRGHEIFLSDFSGFPILRVLDGKTGFRIVVPLYPEWAENWELNNVLLPEFDQDTAHVKLGYKITSWFRRSNCPWNAYDLRHCFARRCFEFGLPPDWGAALCGHSPEVHNNVYRAWIDENTYLRVFKQVIYRPDRPLPPPDD